jgi:hypothetical protein
LALFLALACGCTGGASADTELYWTAEQAESIRSVRGLTVRRSECRGQGEPVESGRYRHFRCVAGARATSDPYPIDTVAVLYVLHPRARYQGPASQHRLTDVRFIGGPGIP